MPELALAYADADERAAARVAAKLERLGYKVTRAEAGVRPGRRAGSRSAQPVLLLWSRAFAKSSRLPRRPLATLRLDAAPPPPMVKAPAIDLRSWRGREDHRGWRKLVGALTPRGAGARQIAARSGAAPVQVSADRGRQAMTMGPEHGATPSKKSARLEALIFLLFLALAGGGAYYALFLQK